MSIKSSPLLEAFHALHGQPVVQRDDEALLRACAKGDKKALGELFDRHDESVRRFLARVCQISATDLDDLVHATFIEAYRSAGAFRARSSARTWIFGIAVNVSRHHTRSEARRGRFLTMLAADVHSGEATSAPHEALEHRQALDRMGSALRRLPYARRAAFVLCEIEGLTASEAGSVLGVRPGTIGRWLHDARKSLRAAIEWSVT
jgi:RNA polymerase sigma factor (sigma-70 family)